MAETKKPGRFGSATRITAILAAMTPVVAGIYQESQEAGQRRAQTYSDQKKIEEDRRRQAEESDKQTARLLQNALVEMPASSDAKQHLNVSPENIFCTKLYLASEQLRAEPESPRTLAVVSAAFKLKNTEGLLRVCACAKDYETRESWINSFVRADMESQERDEVSQRFSQNLRDAKAECDDRDPKKGSLEILKEENKQLKQRLGEQSKSCPAVKKADPPLSSPPSACAIQVPAGETRRLRVFIQTPNAEINPEAERLRTALNSHPPFKSPGIEIVGEKRSPSALQIRFTYEADRKAAEVIETALKSDACGMEKVPVQLVPMPHMQGRTDPGVLEVWWPKSSARGNSQ